MVAVAEGQDYAAITKSAINALGGMGRFVKAGNTVVVKPNMGWDRRPEQAATTHPLVVRSIVEECLKAGAKKVKVFDNTCNDMRTVLREFRHSRGAQGPQERRRPVYGGRAV